MPTPFHLASVTLPGKPLFGCVLLAGGNRLVPTSAFGSPPLIDGFFDDWTTHCAWLQRAVEQLGASSFATHPASIPISDVHFEAPWSPRQVFCVGANYKKHVVDIIVAQGGGDETKGMSQEQVRAWAVELMESRARDGRPYVFSKPISALTGPDATIALPAHGAQPDFELELAVVIARSMYRVPRDEAMSYVAGFVIANDLTLRDQVFRADLKALGSDWLAAKGAPGFMPIGPYLTPSQFVSNPHDLRITLRLNGETMQDESTSEMVFDIARQLEHVSHLVRLLPGDVLSTGSPAGNGVHVRRFLRAGDKIEGTVTGLGTQHLEFVGP